MNTKFYTPIHTPLADSVTTVFEIRGNYQLEETILPKGIYEMIFNLGGDMRGLLPYETRLNKTPRCFVQGIHIQPIKVSFVGEQHLFCLRLKPHIVQKLFKVVPSELNNSIIDLTLITPLYNSLWHQLVEADSFEARLAIINSFFPILEKNDCLRTQKLSELFLDDSISDFKSIKQLSEKVYYSPRHLNRKVHQLFGMSGEELLIYKKYLYAVNLLHTNSSSLTDVAVASGFYDQSHFCKVFKAYSGIKAKTYKHHKSAIPFHLF